jgi:hypothetical protein
VVRCFAGTNGTLPDCAGNLQVSVLVACWDTSQFVRVGDYINLLDTPIDNIQSQDKVRSIIDVRDHTGPPIDGGRTHREAVLYIEFLPHAE